MVKRRNPSVPQDGLTPIEIARQKRHFKTLGGFVAWQVQVKEIHPTVRVPRCGSARAEAFNQYQAALSSTVAVEASTLKMLRRFQQKTALATRMAPFQTPNKQVRPTERILRVIMKRAVPVQPSCSRGCSGLLRVAVAPRGSPLDTLRLEDSSAEYALDQMTKGRSKGAIYILPRAAFRAATFGEEVFRVLLDDGSYAGKRVPEEMVVKVLNFPIGKEWAQRAMAALQSTGIRDDHESEFHMKHHADDERKEDVKSIEFGWSAFPGDAPQQVKAQEEQLPYKLAAWLDPRGDAWVEEFLAPHVLPQMWKSALVHYHLACEQMMDVTMASLYGMCGTGWNKVTVGWNNPTGLHWDKSNRGITALLMFGVHGLRGGTHCLFGQELGEAVIVEETEEGVLVLGDYSRALHGNLATVFGDRFVVNAYCGTRVVERISKC